jgi:Protein of unknown function (DUF3224)
MTTAAGTFVVENWDQDEPYEDGDAGKMSRAHVSKRFSGDLEATSVTELTMINTREAGSDAYVALELLTGSLQGKSGSFVLQHSAVRSGEESSLRWDIVPGSGTGELGGIRGAGTITVTPDGTHSYTLDYDLG